MLLLPNAKINIGLNIVSRRQDGYHNIETIFMPIPLNDTLYVERDDSLASLLFTTADGMTLDCSNNENIIVRLYRQMAMRYALGGVRITLTKHIPFGAGLGGGSSDAAFAAKALNKLFNLNLTNNQLKQEVSLLGADCAFFIENKPCFATGIGDILQPVEISLIGYELLLIKPDNISVNTKTAYQGITPKKPLINLQEAVRMPIEQWKDTIFNDFENTVFNAYPYIRTVKEQCYRLGAVYAAMSGSGASVFGLFKQGTLPQKLTFGKDFVYRTILS